MCGRMNPAANVFCDSCGARLVPATPGSVQESKPVSPPRHAADDTAAKKDLPLPTQPKEEPSALPPSPPPVEASAESGDWLSRLRGDLAPDENVPDWLRGREAENAEPAVAPAPEPANIPDWLQELVPTSKAQLPATPAPAEADVPDWLRELAPTAKTLSPSVAPAPVEVKTPREAPPEPSAPTAQTEAGESEIPDWLRQLEPSPASPVEPSFADADVPDWLKRPVPGESVQAPTPVSAPPHAFEPSTFAEPTPTEVEIPDWLPQLETAPTAAPVQGAPLAVESETPPAGSAEPVPAAQAELPDWLQDLEAPAAISEPEMTLVAPLPFKEPMAVPSEELPDWLKKLGAAGTSVPAPPALTETPAIAPLAGGLVAAQLPAWLKELQPTGAPAEPEKREPAETEGILEGVRGALPVADIVSQALETGMPRPLHPETPANDLARAGVLHDLLARGTAAVVRPEEEGRAQRLWGNTQRWMVFLVIAVLAAFPLLQPNLVEGLVSSPPPEPVSEGMFNNIQALPSGAAVLVAFDYDATQSPEMDTQARVLLRHLAARQANVKVASLYQTGPAVAQAVINQVNSTLTGTLPIKVEYRGYLPGQDAAVAYFIQSTPISMVIDLAATPDTVRWWVEQLAARPNAPTFLAGVSAAAEPMSRPYVESHQVSGMIAGVPGATAYRLKLRQVTLGDTEDLPQVLAPLASIGLANVALVALIVLGGLIQLVSGRRPQPATRLGGRQRG
jgi:hypothetical protein